ARLRRRCAPGRGDQGDDRRAPPRVLPALGRGAPRPARPGPRRRGRCALGRDLMRLCAFTDELSLDAATALRLCAGSRIAEIQLGRVDGPNVVELPDEAVDRLVRLVREFPVRVAGIGSPFGKPPPAAFAAGLDEAARVEHRRVFERALWLAERFGAPTIRV